MKKLFLIIFLIPALLTARAQDNNSFFSEAGEIVSGNENDDLNYALAFIDHRSDDVVWARIVYRMLDLRDTQNNPLYFPLRPNKDQKSLFKLIIDAVVEGVPVYRRNAREIRPDFTDMVLNSDLPYIFAYDEENDKYLIRYDSLTNSVSFDNENYQVYIKDQFRFMIQEVIYFDKHLSRFDSKIIGIAPIKVPREVFGGSREREQDDEENTTNGERPDATKAKLLRDEASLLSTLRESIVCWFLYTDLRPFMARQLVSQMTNSALRLNYDDFFSKHMYHDYLLGDNDLFNKLYSGKEKVKFENLRNEIKQINNKLIDIENSIWEY